MKAYLGDSVYAEFDGYGIKLTTENGFGATNTIVMEPEVLGALSKFSQSIAETIKKEGENNGDTS